MDTIFLPTLAAMRAESCPFKGCLYFGLMLTPDGPKVIEYNCRFGDPETQVVLPLLKTDLLTVMQAVESETLGSLTVEWRHASAACVILASGGYPGHYEKGKPISLPTGKRDHLPRRGQTGREWAAGHQRRPGTGRHRHRSHFAAGFARRLRRRQGGGL